jgi:heptosyltransferase I
VSSEPVDRSRSDLRVLIVLLGALGDVARGLSVATAIRRSRPDAYIGWCVERAAEPLVRLNSAIDEVFVFDRKAWLSRGVPMIRAIRNRRFRVVLDMQRHLKSGLFSYLSGAPRRIGFHRDNAKEGNWLLSTEWIPARDDSLSKLEHYQLFLTEIGIAPSDRHEFGLTERVAAIPLPQVLKETSYVAAVLGSSWESKDWEEVGYRQVLERFVSRERDRFRVVLLGDRKAVPMALRLEASVGTDQVVNLAGATTLPELIRVLAGASAVFGPDSGPGHISGALGVPYIGLFGPTAAARNAPYGSEQLALAGEVPCAPCLRRRCPGLGKACMRLIGVEEVLEKLSDAIRAPAG